MHVSQSCHRINKKIICQTKIRAFSYWEKDAVFLVVQWNSSGLLL